MNHILLIGNTAWGMFNFRQSLISFLISQGFKVTVVAPSDRKYDNFILNTGCNFIPVKISSQGTNVFSDLLLIYKLNRIYKKYSPDLIFHYTIKPNIYGSIAAFMAKIPSVAVVTGLGYVFINKSIIKNIAIFLYRLAFNFSKKVWFLNDEDCNFFIQSKIVNKNKTSVLKGEGVNLDYFMPNFTDNKEFSFLLASRMLYDKGILEYVNAARIIKKNHHNIVFKLMGPTGVDNPKAISLETIKKWEKEGIKGNQFFNLFY